MIGREVRDAIGKAPFDSLDGQRLHDDAGRERQDGLRVHAQELRRGYQAAAVPLRRYDGATIAAICVAVWSEDSSVGSVAERYVAALTEEADALTPQLL